MIDQSSDITASARLICIPRRNTLNLCSHSRSRPLKSPTSISSASAQSSNRGSGSTGRWRSPTRAKPALASSKLVQLTLTSCIITRSKNFESKTAAMSDKSNDCLRRSAGFKRLFKMKLKRSFKQPSVQVNNSKTGV